MIVSAGTEKPLLQTKQQISLKTNPQKGTVRVVTDSDQTSRLLYTPNDVREKTADSLEYILDNEQPQKLTIEIEPKPQGLSEETYQQGFKAIFLLFVLAVVLESALAILFNWRPFVETFNARSVRPIVSFVIAYLLVYKFSMDLITNLVNSATKAGHSANIPGMVVTALVLAGGSAGVNNMLVALGYREKKTPATVAPRPPAGNAWISVLINRKQAVGSVLVFMGTPSATNDPLPLVGVIRGSSKSGLRYFLSDPGRFPSYGGHQVQANDKITVELVGADTNGDKLQVRWGPFEIAGGSIIDLELSL
jgi:hypothetical protein